MEFCAGAMQMCSTEDVASNLLKVKKYIDVAADMGIELIVLPENFASMGTPKEKLKHKETYGKGRIQNFLSQEAKRRRIWIVGGTIPLADPENPNKVFASTLVYNDQGECISRYDKIHLFDIALPVEKEFHHESETISPGQRPTVFDSPFGKCGIAICYDVRFPELFREMQKQSVDLMTLSAAFTVPTGKAHWDVLVRARAIENQVFMIAAAQVGTHSNNRKTYGHSMIVNPWGDVMAMLAEGEGVIKANLNLNYSHQLRRNFPVLSH